MLGEKLVVIGLAVASLGSIKESDGALNRTFWLRNEGDEPVRIVQAYTSCGCTQASFDSLRIVASHDSVSVSLTFNPRGKGGEFYESGTFVYGHERQHVTVAMEGNCISSQESLEKQFPIRLNDDLRLSANHFDLGRMTVGSTRNLYVAVLHCSENNRQEAIAIHFTASKDMGLGLRHIDYPIVVKDRDKTVTTTVRLDVIIL